MRLTVCRVASGNALSGHFPEAISIIKLGAQVDEDALVFENEVEE
jgi:hypothetical protein